MIWKPVQCMALVLIGLCPNLVGARVLEKNDRIVFVGDSITGQGGNGNGGFVHLIGAAIKGEWPESNLSLFPLGGSGQSVGSWINVEQKSRTEDRALDVPGVMIKTTLDQPADVLIVMLGMNDVLYPYVTDKPEDLAAWKTRYETLLKNLRDRLHPRVVALATVTMATEDPDSPKNLLATQLNIRVAALAKEQGCRLLATHEAMQEMLRVGRTWRPDFHVTGDYVHPSAAGHVAIAVGMLRGLEEEAAAQALEEKELPVLRGNVNDLSISYLVRPEEGLPSEKEQKFKIDYWISGKRIDAASSVKIKISTPEGWRVEQAAEDKTAGTFHVIGEPDRIKNTVQLAVDAGDQHQSADIIIPAPWLLSTAVENRGVWSSTNFTPEKGELPSDAYVARGDINSIPSSPQTAQTAIAWRRYFASVDYTGGNNPASIDFWSRTIGRTFETAYGVRWVYSAKPRAVQVQLSSRTFAGMAGMTTWINTSPIYAGLITGEPGKKVAVAANLNAGWNCLAFKSNHLAWLWQIEINLAGAEGDDLSDIRISTIPQKAANPKN